MTFGLTLRWPIEGSAWSVFSMFMKNTGESSFIIDFSDVQFVTRSFMDEFYNGVIKPTCPGFRVRLEQVPTDIQTVLKRACFLSGWG